MADVIAKTTITAKPTWREILGASLRVINWGRQGSPVALPLLFIVVTIVSIVPFIQGFLDSKVIDELVRLVGIAPADRNTELLIQFVALAISAAIVEKILWVIVSYCDKVNYFNITRKFVMMFLEKSSSLDMYHYESPVSNNIIQKARDTYDWKPREFVGRLTWIGSDLVRIVSSMLVILSFSLPAFLLVMATTIPSLIVNAKLGDGSWGIWDANAEDRRKYWWARDLLSKEYSLMELRIFRTQHYLLDIVRGIYDRFTQKEKHDQTRRAVLESIFGNLSTAGTMIFWLIAIQATLDGQISIGLLAFYLGSINRFSDSLNGFVRNISRQYEDARYLVDYCKFIDLQNTIQSGAQAGSQSITAPKIEFIAVDFAYPGTTKFILKNFNLTINPGEKIALVGINGAGKSTLIKLLCRFYDVTNGQILIDGVNIQDLALDYWYKKIGVLFQSFVQYKQFDVRKNIELGDVDKIGDEPAVQDAIFKADAQNFIANYKANLDQILDKSFDGGIDPSGGEWQKIALARAFFRDAPILILDEPTSAIDAKAEYAIFERLYEFSANKTLIIVSHRFSTVRNADKIFVIQNGEIVESATHAELLDNNGYYKDAFTTQAQGYK
jgi:ABC-type multidrug transport system fused ATPase/permease subunit